MSLTVARLIGACATFACLALAPQQAQAHYDDAYYHDSGDLPPEHRWMENLHDDTLLRNISMPGTHGSAARHGGWAAENQTLTIEQQLVAGVRFLDLRTRHYYNTLEMHHGVMYQYQDFPAVMDQIVRFLARYPTQTVFIRVKEEHSAEGNTRNFEDTVNSYFAKYGRYFRTDAHWDMPLREARGKIVMLKEFAGDTPFGKLNFYHDLIRQDDYHLGSNWDLYAKWEKVKNTIKLANTSGAGVAPFVNFLSGSGGAFPYFVASGHSDPATSAGGLSTGLTTPAFNGWYPDFPRGACFIGICTIYFEGTNTLTKNYLRNQNVKYAGIIAADFPGHGLIRSVIEVNYTDRPVANVGNGRCLDVEGGVGRGNALISWSCHGGPNQRLTMHGDQIRVGGMCLDVEGGHNAPGARVLAWPCHGGANQQWDFHPTGQIRSLLPGVKRCIGVNFPNNRTGLVDCAGTRPDQTFRTRVNDNGYVIIDGGITGGTVSPPSVGGGTGAGAGVGPRPDVRVRGDVDVGWR